VVVEWVGENGRENEVCENELGRACCGAQNKRGVRKMKGRDRVAMALLSGL
jgi:hypothetical protein